MKRLIGSVSLLLVLSCYLLSCEKDDLCPETTQTTSRLVLGFYSETNHEAPQAVTRLQVFTEGSQDTIQLSTIDEVSLPLRTDATSTKWGLIYNRPVADGYEPNTDFLEFKYTTREEYVSRACGYKVLFTLEDDTDLLPNPVLTDTPAGGGRWIDGTEILETNIENENDIHIKVYW
ncbi:hypothetical protein GR160_04880 [Flavobacterium sp. Sd200]|uniref:DUF6452 family protein n=1 Tax=Flavobacterium sp. Sd200 TaxID=2692211 RepID=UPI00136BC87F|nr:DUF6452 family protein [Flavobacterium sp. Sd200]MXN90551.1 hypothetical protein [Flavobacterium sp. Sd200]